MSKIKMRCTTCGKWFQSANAKEVTCPDCVQKARKEKLAAKSALPSSSIETPGQGTESSTRPSPPPPPKPKTATSGTSHWIDTIEGIKVSEPEQPQRPRLPSSPPPRDVRGGQGSERYSNRGPGGYREERSPGSYREGANRGPGGYRPGGPGISAGIGQRPRQPMERGVGRGSRPGTVGESHRGSNKAGKPAKAKASMPPTPPKPKREKIPPPAAFVPTPEQIALVEARYMELAEPNEFDGIRTQIAQEIAIPKKAVKKIVKELRERQGIPSWWEMQTYKGSSEELAKIRTAYEPYLPVPPIGVHKKIAEELSLKAGEVYQAIKALRLEMNLPQYNDPALHQLELASNGKNHATAAGEETKESAEEKIAASAAATEIAAEPAEVTVTPSADSTDSQEK